MSKFKELSNRLDTTISKLSNLKFYILGVIFWFIVTYGIFLCMSYFLVTDINNKGFVVMREVWLYASIFLSFLFSGLTTTSRVQLKQSSKFWSKAKEVEELVKSANTKLQIEESYSLYNEMIKLSFGGSHQTEIIRLKTMIETKHELLP